MLTQLKNIRVNFESHCTGLMDYEQILGATADQINLIIMENEMDPNQNMQIMVQLISEISLQINTLGSLLYEPHKQPGVWLGECRNIVEGIEKIVARLNDPQTSNTLVNECLKNYGKTYARQLTQFKFLCCCYGFGISVSSYEYVSFATILKDFAFILSPVVSKLKEGDKK